jgi:hypothetical protein
LCAHYSWLAWLPAQGQRFAPLAVANTTRRTAKPTAAPGPLAKAAAVSFQIPHFLIEPISHIAVIVKTTNAKSLLNEIEKFLQDKKSNTWVINTKQEITHTPEQWNNQAYFKGAANTQNNEIEFHFGRYTNATKTWAALYPYYHGGFVSFLCDHFYGKFSSVTVEIRTDPK